jgi:hypothetical protein
VSPVSRPPEPLFTNECKFDPWVQFPKMLDAGGIGDVVGPVFPKMLDARGIDDVGPVVSSPGLDLLLEG